MKNNFKQLVEARDIGISSFMNEDTAYKPPTNNVENSRKSYFFLVIPKHL